MITTLPKQRGTQKARTASVAAPIGGWNARDPMGAMHELDAVRLENFWPGTNSVLLRKGYTQHVTGLTGNMQGFAAGITFDQ